MIFNEFFTLKFFKFYVFYKNDNEAGKSFPLRCHFSVLYKICSSIPPLAMSVWKDMSTRPAMSDCLGVQHVPSAVVTLQQTAEVTWEHIVFIYTYLICIFICL